VLFVQIEKRSKQFVGCQAVASRGVWLLVLLSLWLFTAPLVFALPPSTVPGGLAPPIGITLTAAPCLEKAEPCDHGDHVITFQVRDALVLLRVQKVRFSVANQGRLAFLQTVKLRSPNLRFMGSDQLAQLIVEAAQQNLNVTLSGRWYVGRGNFFVGNAKVLDQPVP
jgi:hypothetical protein